MDVRQITNGKMIWILLITIVCLLSNYECIDLNDGIGSSLVNDDELLMRGINKDF